MKLSNLGIKQLWICATSDKAIELFQKWKRDGFKNNRNAIIATDSLSLWADSLACPISICHNPILPSEEDQSKFEIYSSISRAIGMMLHDEHPFLEPQIVDIATSELSYLLAPFLIVAGTVEALLPEAFDPPVGLSKVSRAASGPAWCRRPSVSMNLSVGG